MQIVGLFSFVSFVISFAIAIYVISLASRLVRAAERIADALEPHQDLPLALGRIAKAVEER